MMARTHLGLFVVWLLSVGCASTGPQPAPDEGVDDPNHTTSERDASSGAHSTSTELLDAAGGTTVLDGATVVSSPDANQTTIGLRDAGPMGGNQTSGPSSFHDVDTHTSEQPSLDAGSLIIEPDVEVNDVATICDAIWELQGQVIETDISGHVVLGDWSVVQNVESADGGSTISPGELDASAPLAPDAGLLALDSGTTNVDELPCYDKFAPYLVQCEQGPVVVQSPGFVYSEGPTVGGEPVSVGCWERQCAVECLPASVESLARVRASISAVAPVALYDGGAPSLVGSVRINGVEVRAIATLEVIARQ